MDGQDGATVRHKDNNNIVSRSTKTGQSRRTNRTCNNGKRKESIGKNRKVDKKTNNLRHASVSPQNRNIELLNLQNINDPNYLVNNDTLMSPIENSNAFSKKGGKNAILFQDDDSDLD